MKHASPRAMLAKLAATFLVGAIMVTLPSAAEAQQSSTTTIPSPHKPLQTCRACRIDRDACYARCDKQHKSVRGQLECTNACNTKFRCVMGDDCR